ncbi:MAG TPA: dihydrofolate reductase family protein [Myxococcota bacterium]|nr:dihydrofolate reductase family protein [Myxococcota bacterium]
MRKLSVFNHLTLDGYFRDIHGDMSWAHDGSADAEFNAFVKGNATAGGVLLFGRITYELMASYWPTPAAMQNDPAVAEGMNTLEKIVFSRSLNQADWKNTRLLKSDLLTEMRKLKLQSGKDMVILGSGSLVSQLAEHGLIDEYQILVNPIVIGKGKTMFEGIKGKILLKLTKTRSFRNGKVLLSYEPVS